MPKDNKETKIIEREKVAVDFASIARLIVKDLKSKSQDTAFYKKYTKDDVRRYIENPDKFEKELRSMSRYLYDASPHYRRLINYFAKMLLFNYVVEPIGLNIDKINAKTFKASYLKAVNYLDNINFKHEFHKILTVAFREDVFFGYEYSTDESYFIQKLNPDYCKISSVEDGVFNFAFNFAYFDRDKNKLLNYAPEFTAKYNAYLKDRNNMQWQELDSNNTICIKINEDMEYVCPIFLGVFESLYDIQDYKALKKARTELDNYKILVMTIPLRKDSDTNNDFSVELDLMKDFYGQAAESLPDQVGLILSPTDVNAINLNQSNNAQENSIEFAEKSFWDGAGVTSSLFNSNANSGATLNKSIVTDEEICLSVLSQIERWANRKLKVNVNGTYKFKAKFLEMTVFSKDEVRKGLLEGCQYGLPLKTRLVASYDVTPASMMNMCYLENEVLKLDKIFIPLQSSHTQSGDDKGGNPGKGDNVEAKTETTQKTDGNNPQNWA